MKVYFGVENSCAVNYQHSLIYDRLSKIFEVTKRVEEADVIVLAETCVGTEPNLEMTLNYIDLIYKRKKKEAKLYVTGCIAREFQNKEYLPNVLEFIQERVDFLVPQNQPNLLLKLVSEDNFSTLAINDFGMVHRETDEYEDGQIDEIGNIYLANGCLNRCSFCKVTFQNYPLKSVPLNEVKEAIDRLDEEGVPNLAFYATNVCQYGFDLYHDYKLPELVEYVDKKKNIKNVLYVGFSYADAIRNAFQEPFAKSPKHINLSGSLESGSDRILKLMRKGFVSAEIIDFVQAIRRFYERSLQFCIISGFPTEKIEDVRRTLEVLKILAPYAVNVSKYINSSFVDSNMYPQLDERTIQEHTRTYLKVLRKRNVMVNLVGEDHNSNC